MDAAVENVENAGHAMPSCLRAVSFVCSRRTLIWLQGKHSPIEGRRKMVGNASHPPLPCPRSRQSSFPKISSQRWRPPTPNHRGRTTTSTTCAKSCATTPKWRSEEHTSELQSLMRISYAVFCLKKKTQKKTH